MDGTAVIAVSQDGQVQGCEVDFDQSKPAGFDLEDAQAERARIRLAGKIIRDQCSHHFYQALTMDSDMPQKVMGNLREIGWRFEVRSIPSETPKEDQSDG